MEKADAILEGVLNFAFSNYLSEWKPFLLRLLKLSRSQKLKSSPTECISVQMDIAKAIAEAEQVIRAKKMEQGFKKDDPSIIYNQRLRHILKDIADGIAWRLLDFNRPLMRILSQNRSPGFLKTEISKEDDIAMDIATLGNQAIINDITNIMRVGDLTVIDSSGHPKILEVKGSGKKVWSANDYRKLLGKGGDLSNQANKILEIDKAINECVIKIDSRNACYRDADIPLQSYIDIVESVLTRCQSEGVGGNFIDGFMYIRAYKIGAEINNMELPFKINNNWYVFSSIDTLLIANDEVYRNKIPYSAYPFSDDIVMELLSGEVILESYINIIALRRRFERAGWKIKSDNISKAIKVSEMRSELINGQNLIDFDINIKPFIISKDGFDVEIGAEQVGLILYNFYKPEIITNTVQYISEITGKARSNTFITARYLSERDIWV